MKSDFGLIKKSHGYAISSITDKVVWFATQILVGKIMRKCLTDEVLAPVVSFTTQYNKGIQFNWASYLCQEFLKDCRKTQEDGNVFHYAWLLLLIALTSWRTLDDS